MAGTQGTSDGGVKTRTCEITIEGLYGNCDLLSLRWKLLEGLEKSYRTRYKFVKDLSSYYVANRGWTREEKAGSK